ncbi:MFS transporter [Clostridium sp. KNHs214]|uniref:MFS transporter n=1 Tax=Clostridium sp. KNHs214 TaxID=1540257 RepID=UPI000691E02D|nr:MFS transporter [Clostridium sp. KNHs214]
MNYKKNLRRNINLNYLFVFLNRLDLTQGVWMIYLASRGLSLAKLGMLEGIFHITSFLMEVPTGAVADIYGRKVSRTLGRVFCIISNIVLILSTNFYLFALSFAILAISYNLESGAGEALLYDSLKELGEEKSYMKINGFNEMILEISCIFSLMLGGYLAHKNYLWPFALSAVFAGIALLESTFFQEPSVGRNKNLDNLHPLKVFKNQTLNSFKIVKSTKKISLLIIFAEVMAVFGTSLFYYLQNYWKGNGLNEFKIGIIFAISSLINAFIAPNVHKIEKLFKERILLIFLPIATCICIWCIAFTNYSYVFFIAIEILQTIMYIVTSDYLNKLIPSENRATILSFQSMVFSFFMIFLFPLIGKIGDLFTLNTAFKFLGFTSGIFAILNVFIICCNNK